MADTCKVIQVAEQLQVQIVEDDLNAAAEEGYELAISMAAGKNGFIRFHGLITHLSVRGLSYHAVRPSSDQPLSMTTGRGPKLPVGPPTRNNPTRRDAVTRSPSSPR